MAACLIVGAPRSGSGKTTVTLALLAAFRRRGLAVRAAKSGPDYIDPAFHAAATGRPCWNLDTWAMPPVMRDAMIAEMAADADLLVIESAMGVFDGVPATRGRSGAAADLASRHGLPVLLVLDVTGQSQTAAAVARGFTTHDPAVRIAGVILNRVGSDRHRDSIARALETVPLPLFGALPRDAAVALPERHLGLVQAGEQPDLGATLTRLADLAEAHFDLDAILAAAAPSPNPLPREGEASTDAPSPWEGVGAGPPPGQRIALAQDAAFSFVYPHLTESWRRAGAEIVPFSPLADEPPPDDCTVCWLPGGYPELHAARLAAASRFGDGMARFAGSRAVHGECGGHMVLGTALTDASGQVHPMLGLLGHATSFAKRRLTLGYREATLLSHSVLGPPGTVLRGHEFHYSSTTDRGTDAPLARITDAQGKDLGVAGSVRGRVSGSFFHLIAVA